jgi:hypothetical protein
MYFPDWEMYRECIPCMRWGRTISQRPLDEVTSEQANIIIGVQVYILHGLTMSSVFIHQIQ